MSISDLRHEAVTVRLSRKRDILGRYKEVLSEIFYFTKHPEVTPDSDSILEQVLEESSDLKEFLSLNDLESGHVFQESTLPKPQTVAVTPSTEAQAVNSTVIKAAPPTPVTPQNANATSLPPQPSSSGSGRMVTRVSSGAIRHKSIGELLGEKEFTPKHTPTRSTETIQGRGIIDSLVSGFQESHPVPKTPNPPTTRTRGTIFQDTSQITPPSTRVELDRLQAAAEIFPLDHLISKAHKSVRTTDWTKAMDEKRTVAIINRIVELKEQNLWSLRQPAKQRAPSRSMLHWDYMLKEMEWMATDFYEERKFKMAGAFILSRAVQKYFESDNKESLLHTWPRQVRTPVKHFEEDADADEDVLMVNHRGSASPMSMDNEAEPMHEVENPPVNGVAEKPTPMLIDPPREAKETEPQALPTPPSSCELEDLPAIFDLPSDVIYATVNELPKKDGSSLSQLPIYGPPVVTDEPYHDPIDDLPIVPISKFCLERYIVPLTNWKPPNRHYRQATPEHPDDILDISKEVQVEPIPTFAPAGTEISHGSRRRSSAIIIRPPPPPTHWSDQKSSPWTPEEERQLLQSARDNMYNFELVASTLSFSASSISDLEKRSAWECFEKFRQIYPEPQNIQLAGPHRNLAMNRIDKGIRLSMNRTRANAIARQPRLEVRNHRYLNLFDAMRKSAKNREKNKAQEKPVVKKQKDNLPTKPTVNVPTPMDLSRLKAERDRAFNQAILAERQAQAVRLQMPAGASPEVQEEVRRQWFAQQQQNALLNGQAIRQNPGLGRGLVIPGARPMPIRPNNGTNAVVGNVPVRLPNGATATPEQVQHMIKVRQLAMAVGSQNGTNAPTQQQMQRLRALQQAQLNAAQNAGVQSPTNATGVVDYMPFISSTNGTVSQAGAAQAGNLVQNRLMQPPQQNGAVVPPGIRQPTPQLQLPQQSPQGLRATPPRPSNLSPTAQHFPVTNPGINLQSVLAFVQQTNPQLSPQEATKVALDQLARYQQGAQNNLLQQHLQQQLAKSSPTLANQQIRRSPSQNSGSPHAPQRMS